LILGGGITIWQARNAVRNEVDSSIRLALQLIEINIGSSQSSATGWVYRLSALEQTRHLKIQLIQSTGRIIKITHGQLPNERQDSPPEWFVKLVVSDYPKAEYQIKTFDNQFTYIEEKRDGKKELGTKTMYKKKARK